MRAVVLSVGHPVSRQPCPMPHGPFLSWLGLCWAALAHILAALCTSLETPSSIARQGGRQMVGSVSRVRPMLRLLALSARAVARPLAGAVFPARSRHRQRG